MSTKKEIQDQAVAIVLSYANMTNEHSNANIAHFKSIYHFIQAKKTRDARVAILEEEAESIELDSAKREFNANLKMCVTYAEIQDWTVFSKIDWVNLKKVVAAYKKVAKDMPDKEDEFKETINGAYAEGQSEHNYNNRLDKILKDWAKANKVEKKADAEQVGKDIATLTNEEKATLIKSLTEDVQGQNLADLVLTNAQRLSNSDIMALITKLQGLLPTEEAA